jgi:chaperonin GroEL
MPKQITFNEDARRSLKRGVDIVANAVRTTLGPRGRNVALDSTYGAPTVTHDGVTIAKAITLNNPFENMGARLLVEVATRTNDITGDGTTTATVLAQAIIAEGFKVVTAGANPMQMKRGLDKGSEAIINSLKHMARPIRDRADIAHVASISAASTEIGELIAEIMDKVGRDGIISVEESKGIAFETEYTEGMQIDRGYISAYFVTDTARMVAELDDPCILITDKKITAIAEILPVLEEALKITKNIVIIADDINGEVLATLVVNKIRGTMNALAIKAPSFGDRRKAMLQDIAILTGGTVISEEIGRKLESAAFEDLGRARRVVTDKDTTTFIESHGDKQAIAMRVAHIRTQIESNTNDFEREKLQERVAKLIGGVAVLKVGAATEPELKEKKHRVEDALSTARAAVEEGIVPGGGVALLNAIDSLNAIVPGNDDERIGIQILRRALEEPMRQLARNAGEDGAVIIAAVRRSQQASGDIHIGYNVITGAIGSMLEQGVIDPVKVTRSAIQNAVSIAGLLLTTEVLIADLPDGNSATAMQAGDMDGLDY